MIREFQKTLNLAQFRKDGPWLKSVPSLLTGDDTHKMHRGQAGV